MHIKEWVRKEIGAEQLAFIEEKFIPRLYGTDVEVTFRVAPSIVARSECELFSVSAPRFAARAVLSNGSFLNLRRLPFLANTVEGWSKRRDTVHASQTCVKCVPMTSDHSSPADLIRHNVLSSDRGRCIADSYLVPPTWVNKYFSILTTELATAYGEASDKLQAIQGLPFLRHIRLGGGMCAQATCFMANALLHQHAHGVYGVAEITALSHSSDSLEIDLGGMNARSVAKYFCHPKVGLRANLQWPRSLMARAGLTRATTPLERSSHRLANVRLAAKIFRAYVLSGFPVILPIDLGLMLGHRRAHASAGPLVALQSIAERNSYARAKQGGVDRPMSHAVVVVGASHDRPHDFLINDPATFPFQRASAEQLFDCRLYQIKEEDALATASPLKQFDELTQDKVCTFIPVTPKSVRMPLYDTYDTIEPVRGVTTLYDLLQRCAADWFLGITTNGLWALEFGDCRLLKLDDISRLDVATWMRMFGQTEGQANSIAPFVRTQFELLSNRAEKWCWIQHIRREQREWILIWDASQEICSVQGNLTHLTGLKQYLLAAFRRIGGSWEVLHYEPDGLTNDQKQQQAPIEAADEIAVKPADAEHASKPRQKLRASLISSFASTGASSVHKQCDAQTVLEWYTFMQSELGRSRWKKELSRLTGKLPRTAMEFMGSFCSNLDVINRMASDVQESLPTGTGIVGLASYVPTISHGPESRHAEVARNALFFLYRFARSLKEQMSNMDADVVRPSVIEIVAGSRVEGLWPADVTRRTIHAHHPQSFVANLFSDEEASKNLLCNLRMVMDRIANEIPDSDEHTISWAIELEPGPLFVLRDIETLTELCRLLRSDQRLCHSVGVNLDIAHWRLAMRQNGTGISETLVRQLEASEIFSQIAHSHVAGHHFSAHFGDIALRTLNDPADFTPWIALLERRNAQQIQGGLPFSGHISLELEAIPDGTVQRALRDLQTLVSDPTLKHWPA